MQQTLTITNRVHMPMHAQPIHNGVPWPQGTVRNDTSIVARTEDGAPLPIAARTLNRWPDGSVQWSLLDFAIDLEPSGKSTVTIEAGAKETAPPPLHALIAQVGDDGVRVSNGLATLKISSRPGVLVEEWTADGRPVAEANGFDVVVRDVDGVELTASQCSSKQVRLEEANPLRAVIRIDGKHEAADGRTLLHFWLRFTVTAGRADVKVTYNYRNYEKDEPGIYLKSLALQLKSALPANAERAIVHPNRTRDFKLTPYRLPEDFEIVSSDSPDLDHYYENHQAKGIMGGGWGRTYLRQHELLRDDSIKPWFLQNVADFKFGNVFPPEWGVWSYIGLVSGQGSLLVAGGKMNSLHPKSLSVQGNVLSYNIWPEWAGPLDVTQGEGRTLDFFVGPLPPNAADMDLMRQYFSWEWGNFYQHHGQRPPVKVSMDTDHIRRCGVFSVDKLPRYEPHDHFAFERKVYAEWTPDEPAPANGHFNYGDVFTSYTVGGNNEEMAGRIWFEEYLRSGRPECLDRGMVQAQHILDVDIVMYSNDPYQNGGMVAHCPRHNHGAAYPSHMWFTELLYAYALTGDEEFKKGAAKVCDALTFWVNDPVGFGHVSADGRESGQPLINLAFTYEFIPEQRYLDAINKIVRGSFMAKVEKYGQLVYMKPREDLPILRDESYGQWAAWEGLYFAWEVTRDEELKQFILSQLDWRLTEERMATTGIFRETDFNVAAYAYLMTGDKQWLDRVARPFKAAFRAANWQFAWIKSMYFIKLAFEHGMVNDDMVLVS